MNKTFLTHEDVQTRVEILAGSIIDMDFEPELKIYPVPRGGVPVAYSLLKHFPHAEVVNSPQEAHIIVDDLVDSGATFNRFREETGGKPFGFLVDKRTEPELGWVVFPWESSVEGSAEDIVLRQLQFIGEDPTRQGLKETPRRVINSWSELYGGYHQNVEDVFKAFDEKYDELVVMSDIEMYSMCEHHMLPFTGRAHIGYIANGKVIGASKLARILEVFSRRLQVQERIGQQVVQALMHHLHPKGAACIIEAKHHCMCSRGIGKQHSVMKTSCMRGVFLQDSYKGIAARNEFMALVRSGNSI